MRIKTLVVGPIDVNCHILWDADTKEAIVVDPGGNPERIMAEIKKDGLTAKAVVNTHGHSDHIGCAILGIGFSIVFSVPVGSAVAVSDIIMFFIFCISGKFIHIK